MSKKLYRLNMSISLCIVTFVLIKCIFQAKGLDVISLLFILMGVLIIFFVVNIAKFSIKQEKTFKLSYYKKMDYSFLAMLVIMMGYMLIISGNLKLIAFAFLATCFSVFLIYLDSYDPYITKNGILYHGQLIKWTRFSSYNINNETIIFVLNEKKIQMIYDNCFFSEIIRFLPIEKVN